MAMRFSHITVHICQTEYLLSKSTLACDTVTANREVPTELQAMPLGSGGSTTMSADNLVATKYHSTKLVYLLSSFHGHQVDEVHSHKVSKGTKHIHKF